MKLAFLLVMALASAQEFEAATVRVSKSEGGVRGGCRGVDSEYSPSEAVSAPPLGRCVIANARLGHLIGIAYGVGTGSIRSGPEWIARGFDRFDVQAKAEGPSTATEAQLREMLQNLLADRFQLRLHRETVERQGFAMVMGKSAPRLHRSDATEPSVRFSPKRVGPISVTIRKGTLAQLAQALSQFHPVIDQTGLTGEYDVTITWDDIDGPPLAAAVQEQLGLRMEPVKVPGTVYVVDSAQKPKAN